MKTKTKRLINLILAFVFVFAFIIGTAFVSSKPRKVKADGGVSVVVTSDKEKVVPGGQVTITMSVALSGRTGTWAGLGLMLAPLNGEGKADMQLCNALTMVGQPTVSSDFASYTPNINNSLSSTDASTVGLVLTYSYVSGTAVPVGTNFEVSVTFNVSSAVASGNFEFGIVRARKYKVSTMPADGGRRVDDLTTDAAFVVSNKSVAVTAPSNDATLKSLSVNGDVLELKNSMSYSVKTNATSFTVVPETNDANAVVTVSNSSFSAGGYSVNLQNGKRNVEIKVTAEDKTTTRTYVLNVTSSYVRLQSLTASSNSAKASDATSVNFNEDVKTYSVTVASDATSVVLVPTVKSSYGIAFDIAVAATACTADKATVTTGNGVTVTGVKNGSSVRLTATAADGVTTYDYTVNFTVASVETGLTALTVTGEGDNKTYSPDGSQSNVAAGRYYFLLDDESNYRAKMNITPADGNAKITVNGASYNPNTVYNENSYTVTVTAEAGNTQNYTVIIAKNVVSAILTSLEISTDGTNFSDVFSDPNYNNYTFNKSYNLTEVKDNVLTFRLSATSGAVITTSANMMYTNGLYQGRLNVGVNEFKITTTSSAGNMVYTLSITLTEGITDIDNITLANLEISAGNIDGFTFDKSTYEYNVTVPYKTSSLRLTVTTKGQYAYVYTQQNGQLERNSGNRTHYTDRRLSDGNAAANTIRIYVKADNGTGASGREYVIHITRTAAEKENKLSSLTVSNGSTNYDLSPAFDPDTVTYQVIGDINNITSVNIKAVAKGKFATVTGAGTVNLGEISVSGGTAKIISVTVTPEDPNTPAMTYRIIFSQTEIELNGLYEITSIQVMGNGENYLKNFAANTHVYNLTVPYSVDRVFISVERPSLATVTGAGDKSLAVGENVFVIYATAENGTNANGALQKFTVTVTRQAALDKALLSDLQVNNETVPSFDPDVFEYSVQLPNDVTEAMIKAFSEKGEANVSIQKDGVLQSVSNSFAFCTLGLNEGERITLTITVSLNGAATPYVLRIYRASHEPELITLEVTGYALLNAEGNEVEFDPSVKEYYVQIDYGVDDITVIAEANIGSVRGAGFLNLADLFKEGLARYPWQVAVIPESGRVAVYWLYLSRKAKPDSNTNANITIEGMNSFNEKYNNFEDIYYGPYKVGPKVTSLNLNVVFDNEIGTLSPSYTVYYNGEVKYDSLTGQEEAAELRYGKNIVTVRILASDGVTYRNVVIAVQRNEAVEDLMWILICAGLGVIIVVLIIICIKRRGRRVVDAEGKAVGGAEKLTLKEEYVKLSEEQRSFFNGLKDYAMSKPDAVEKYSKFHLQILEGGTPIIKLCIRKERTVALFKIEDEQLKQMKRSGVSDGTVIRMKETELTINNAYAFDTAKEIIDLRCEQIAQHKINVKEKRKADRAAAAAAKKENEKAEKAKKEKNK